MKQRLFILDDDGDMVRLLTDLLTREGFAVESSTRAVDGLRKIRESRPDLLPLDIRLDEGTGLQICRQLKEDPKTRGILIVMLSSKIDESDVVSGLELGAEDYIRKPVQKAELLARLRTVLRRLDAAPESSKIVIGPLSIDFTGYTAQVGGRTLDLRPKEFELLGYLARREGTVVTRASLSHAVWGHDHLPTSKTIDVTVHELRKKLGDYGRWIDALKGVGYRFEVDEEG